MLWKLIYFCCFLMLFHFTFCYEKKKKEHYKPQLKIDPLICFGRLTRRLTNWSHQFGSYYNITQCKVSSIFLSSFKTTVAVEKYIKKSQKYLMTSNLRLKLISVTLFAYNEELNVISEIKKIFRRFVFSESKQKKTFCNFNHFVVFTGNYVIFRYRFWNLVLIIIIQLLPQEQ